MSKYHVVILGPYPSIMWWYLEMNLNLKLSSAENCCLFSALQSESRFLCPLKSNWASLLYLNMTAPLSKPSAVFYCWCSSWSGKHRAAAAAAGTGSIVSSDWVKADEVLLLVQPSPPPPAPTPPQHQYQQQQQQQRQEEDRKMVAAHTSSHSSESSEWIICLDKR